MLILDNLGSTLVYLAIIAFIFLIYFILSLFCYLFPHLFIIKMKEWLGRNLFWNSIIAFLINQFQPLFMLSIVNFYDLRSHTFLDNLCGSFAISMLILTLSFMVISTIIMKLKNAN